MKCVRLCGFRSVAIISHWKRTGGSSNFRSCPTLRRLARFADSDLRAEAVADFPDNFCLKVSICQRPQDVEQLLLGR